MSKWGFAIAGLIAGALVSYLIIERQSAEGPAPEMAATGGQPSEPVATWLEKSENEFAGIRNYAERASWVQANFTTDDTVALAGRANKDFTELMVRLAREAKAYDNADLTTDQARKIGIIKQGQTIPGPDDPAKIAELSEITSGLEKTYAEGKYCRGEGDCLADVDIIRIMANSRDPDELLDLWQGWRKISPPMKPRYARMVEIANEGARELGYDDVGALWRSGYDMSADDFVAEAERLWGQVKPLYDSLQCYVRDKLIDHYGDVARGPGGTIPAHLLGNIWAQEWGNIFPLVAEGSADPGYDLTSLLRAADYNPHRMVQTGEAFFTSIGFDSLPQTFWQRSLFTKPADRTVQCHASAWDIDAREDVRIKMCIEVNADYFETIHHELGHNFYQRAYMNQPPLYKGGANDGFHEAIGDFIALSVTPSYLVQLGLLDKEPDADKDIGLLLSRALDKVAFLPFGLLVDKWRWQVFSGQTTPDHYNADWWALRRQYQGISPPVERSEADFDPGAKYHIPANTPYMRYFLARILQFQFHQAACRIAGFKGPLHRCSIYGNEEVGQRLKAMLEMGRSRPWPDALEAFTGSRQMDGSAILAYFAPLKTWLDNQNEGKSCGWTNG